MRKVMCLALVAAMTAAACEKVTLFKTSEDVDVQGDGAIMPDMTGAGNGSIPSGRIYVVDSDLSKESVGVKGMMVSCNTFVKFSNVYTDSEGNHKKTGQIPYSSGIRRYN